MEQKKDHLTLDALEEIDNISSELTYEVKIQPPPKRIIVGEYSAILTSYELLLSNNYDLNKGEKDVLIIQPFWLENVHESRLDTSWGQHVREFPPNISKLLKKMYPDIDKQERVTFEQIKELRNKCIDVLKKSDKYEIIQAEVASISLEESKEENKHLNNEEKSKCIKIVLKDGNEHFYEYSEDMKIYNFSQTHKKDTLNLNLAHQTELYQFEKGNEPKKIIVFGAGLSAVWVKEQASKSDVRVVIRNNKTIIPASIARNKDFPIIKEKCLCMDECIFMSLNAILNSNNESDETIKKAVNEFAEKNKINLKQLDKNYIVGFKRTDLEDQIVGEVLEIGFGYIALGYEPNKKICDNVPEEMVIYPVISKESFYAPRNIPFDAFFARHEIHKRLILKNEFSVEHINLHALVIREEDKPLLSKELGVAHDFINYLCNEIKKEEDTPVNVDEFIHSKYKSWLINEKKEANPDFKNNLDKLLVKITKYNNEATKSYQISNKFKEELQKTKKEDSISNNGFVI